MKNILWAVLTLLVLHTSCKPKNPDAQVPSPSDEWVIIEGDITEDMTLKADTRYKLKGFVFVKDGATLSIEPGTVIVGDKLSKATLVITRTGRIEANGTPSAPIVFTSEFEPGLRNAGDWGGIVLLGKAPVNVDGGEAKVEGGVTPTDASKEKEYIWYGGSEPGHSSGSMKYVRIEFAGIAFSPDNEINSLTLAGVGSGTTISHIQVYRAGDDAFEWFGGTVNCDHLIATYTVDDDFDTDLGYSGQVQFALVQRARNIADVSGSNAFESDNNGNGTTATPQTSPVFSNVTIVGPYEADIFSGISFNYQHGVQIRRNSSLSLHNSLILGFPVGLYIDNTKGEPTSANITAGTLKFNNNIIAGCKDPLKTSAPYTLDEMSAWISSSNNQILPSTLDVGLADPYKFSSSISSKIGRPDFRLTPGSIALSGANFSGLTGFVEVSYLGAFDAFNDWTEGWAEHDADNKVY